MKQHPENLDDIKSIGITDEIKEFVSQLATDVDEEKSNRKWWEEKIDRYRCLRYGIRKPKTHPWPGCANYSLPLIDADITRLKPAYVNLAYSVSPVVTFQPYGPEDLEPAQKREKLFDWRLRTKVKFFPPYVLGIDRMLEQGLTVFKTIWKFNTRTYSEIIDIEELAPEVVDVLYDARVSDEDLFKIFQEELKIDLEHEENIDAINKAIEDFRSGETKLELDIVETADNQPEVIAVDLREDLVVPQDTINLNDARLIDYIFPTTVNDLKIAMRDGKYEHYDEDEIESWANKTPTDKQPGLLYRESDDVVWIHETCCWKDVNDDGIKERCITTWPEADPSSPLRFIELPYDHGEWPYVDVRRELNDDGFYTSRGIPELDEDFQKGISTLFNQTVDAGTIMNNPQVVYKTNTLVNPRNIRYTPGERVEVNSTTSDYEVRQLTNIAQPAMLQLSQYLKSWADQRNGNQTSGVSDDTVLSGQGQGGKKTAKEIELITALHTNVQSLDLQVFQQQMARVYHQIDSLYDQFGDDEETILVTGQLPERVTRGEIQGKFDVVPNGRLDNSTPQVRLRKAVTALQLFNQDPYIKQRELREFVMDDLDDNLSQRVVKTEQEVMQEQQMQMQMQMQMQNEQLRKQIGIRKMSDDMDIRKEMLLTPIQGKKFAPN